MKTTTANDRLKSEQHATETAIVRNLVEKSAMSRCLRAHARRQRGELTFRAMAAELGLSVRELYEVLEQKGLPT